MATITWLGTTNDLWSNAANWSGGVVPTTTDDIVLDGSIYNNPLTVNGSARTILGITVQNGYTAAITMSSGQLMAVSQSVFLGAQDQFDALAYSSDY